MKKFLNLLLLTGTLSCLLYACKKDEDRAVLNLENSPVLAASTTTLALDSTNAATKTALTLTWSAMPTRAEVPVTYTLQIDTNVNFNKAVSMSLATSLLKTYTVADFNTLALSFGLAPAVTGQLQVRVKADINQSNGVTSTVPSHYSNVVKLAVMPYSVKPKPLYPVPAALFIVGDATPGDWANPVPAPAQQFTQIDENTFGMVIQLTGGKGFLLLPVNGDWSHKYALTGTSTATGGAFAPDAANNMTGPSASGLYKIIVDFVKGTYSITPVTAALPTNLYIVGDATPGDWNNPVPVPSQQFTRKTSGEFEISIRLTSGKSYVFLPLNGDWAHKYGGTGKTGGALLSDGAVPGSNTPAPDVTGTYKINVNFLSNQYTVKP